MARQAWVAPPGAHRAAGFIPTGGLQLGDWSLAESLTSESPTDPSEPPAIPGAIFSPITTSTNQGLEDEMPLDRTSRTLLVLPPGGDSVDEFLAEQEL